MRQSYQHADAEAVYTAVERPESRPKPESSGTASAQRKRKPSGGNDLPAPHIPVKNMMCAFGVPGNITHGTPGAGFSLSPVDAPVAPGM